MCGFVTVPRLQHTRVSTREDKERVRLDGEYKNLGERRNNDKSELEVYKMMYCSFRSCIRRNPVEKPPKTTKLPHSGDEAQGEGWFGEKIRRVFVYK